MNFLFPIIILGAIVAAGVVIYQARKNYADQVFTTSDEIVEEIVKAGGAVERINKVGNSERNGGITFVVEYTDSTGSSEKRTVFQEINEEGITVGPLSWDTPLISKANQPPVDNLPPVDEDNQQSLEGGSI